MTDTPTPQDARNAPVASDAGAATHWQYRMPWPWPGALGDDRTPSTPRQAQAAAASRRLWVGVAAAAAALMLLLAFQQVVSGAVRRGEERREAHARLVDATWRCSMLPSEEQADLCMAALVDPMGQDSADRQATRIAANTATSNTPAARSARPAATLRLAAISDALDGRPASTTVAFSTAAVQLR